MKRSILAAMLLATTAGGVAVWQSPAIAQAVMGTQIWRRPVADRPQRQARRRFQRLCQRRVARRPPKFPPTARRSASGSTCRRSPKRATPTSSRMPARRRPRPAPTCSGSPIITPPITTPPAIEARGARAAPARAGVDRRAQDQGAAVGDARREHARRHRPVQQQQLRVDRQSVRAVRQPGFEPPDGQRAVSDAGRARFARPRLLSVVIEGHGRASRGL